jgi:hypothetical protein
MRVPLDPAGWPFIGVAFVAFALTVVVISNVAVPSAARPG